MRVLSHCLVASLVLLSHVGFAQAEEPIRHQTLTSIDGDLLVGSGHYPAGDEFQRTTDVVLTRRAPDGAVRWTKSFDAPGERDALMDAQVHPDGTIHLVGWTAGVICPEGQSSGLRDAFVMRLSASGELEACAQFGSKHFDMATRVRFLSNGDLVIVGNARGPFEGQRWAGSIHETTYAEAYDIFVTRRTRDGAKIWTRTYGTKEKATPRHGGDEAWDLVVDAKDNIHVAGYVGGPKAKNRAPGGVAGVLLEYSPKGERKQARFLNARRGAKGMHLARRASDGRISLGGYAMSGGNLNLVKTWKSRGAKPVWREEMSSTGSRMDADGKSRTFMTSVRGMRWNRGGDLEIVVSESVLRSEPTVAYVPTRAGLMTLDGETGRLEETTWFSGDVHVAATEWIADALYVLGADGGIAVVRGGELSPL